MTLRNTPLAAALALACLAGSVHAADAPKAAAKDGPCTTQVKEALAAKALADVKLADEYERSDAQVYLIRLELSITKRELAAALAKCGATCDPSKP